MRHGGSAAAAGHRAATRQEGSLNRSTFVGSYADPRFHLTPPLPEIAFLGRSNVGKSSLLNAIVSRKALARTSRTPGKTQLCNVFDVDNRFYLVDLPGYGYARASKSARAKFHRLITGYLEADRALAGTVWLLDLRRDPSAEDLRMGNLLADRGVPVLIACTKADKIGRSHRAARLAQIASAVAVPTEQCIMTGSAGSEGIEELREAIEGAVTAWH